MLATPREVGWWWELPENMDKLHEAFHTEATGWAKAKAGGQGSGEQSTASKGRLEGARRSFGRS